MQTFASFCFFFFFLVNEADLILLIINPSNGNLIQMPTSKRVNHSQVHPNK